MLSLQLHKAKVTTKTKQIANSKQQTAKTQRRHHESLPRLAANGSGISLSFFCHRLSFSPSLAPFLLSVHSHAQINV